jgi:hypothetical protein
VVVENYCSSPVSVISCIPQGSVLGPLLFIMYVNDICDVISSNDNVNCALFADDMKLYSSFQCDNVQLQDALVKLSNWCKLWQMSVNVSKSYILHIGCNNPQKLYYFDGNSISENNVVRDLGVLIDNKLTFDQHISRIIANAYSKVGLIFRGFASRNLNIMKKAFITYVRPALEYASNVWCPYLKKHIESIERVQRYFTRRIPVLSNFEYRERLNALTLDTLELRRLRSDLIFYYKIFAGLSPWTPEVYFKLANINGPTCTRSGGNFILLPICRTNKAKNDFFYRRIACWNSLPENVRNSKSLPSFRNLLNNIDLTNFLSLAF